MLRKTFDRTCWILLVLVVGQSLYRYISSPDPYRCAALLDGRWIQPMKQWQPPGCMLHNYDTKDVTTCLQGRLAFIGDSTVREVFWAMAEKLDVQATSEAKYAAEKHSDIKFKRGGIEINFTWDPYLNSSKLDSYLGSFDLGGKHTAQHPLPFRGCSNALTHSRWSEKLDTDSPLCSDFVVGEEDRTAIVLIGGGLWDARDFGDLSTKKFNSAMDRIMAKLHRSGGEMVSFATSIALRPGQDDLLAIAPVRVPEYRSLSPDRAATLTQDKIIPMNDYLGHLVTYHGAPVIQSFSEMTWGQPLAFQKDGLHVVNTVATLQADVLLNMRCNAKLSQESNYPMNKTCCSAYRRPNWIHRILLLLSLAILPLISMAAAKGISYHSGTAGFKLLGPPEPRRITFLPSKKISYALMTLMLAASYSYVADRTQVFSKMHKQFSADHFHAMCLITLALGVLSIRRSVQPLVLQGQRSTTKKIDQPFLSRDQTDEWKGWMQFLILIYHYTGASSELGIYKIIRVLVAAYLFMTGFGHTVYFYRKGDYSLRRCAAVLLRINILSCVLPYFMRTDYLFYYFAPLTSLWYLVIYLTMRIGQHKNTSSPFLIGKIVVSALLMTVIIRTPGVLESLFHALDVVAHVHWNVIEWRFRVQLDNYIVYIGMLSAIVFIKISDIVQNDNHTSTITLLKRIRTLAIIVAAITLPLYQIAVSSITEKFEFISWNPYTSWLPILSFVVLRNSSRHLRNFHSSIFAWLGRHSLETFILQFHIWLAADTTGLLSLGFGRWIDFVPITIVFVWASWHVAAATSTITSWLVDPKADRREAEIEEGGGGEMELLPRTKSKEDLSSYRQLVNSTNGASRVLRNYLPVRLGVLVVVMWGLNMLY